MMEEVGTPQSPQLQIMPVENGFLITAYYGNVAKNDVPDMLSGIMQDFSAGGDPAQALSRAMSSMKLKESTRRKTLEHHVAKSIDEVLKLVPEILGSMKSN